ncbi:MAG: hypothetical protein JWN26_217 [Candidatus Saccharibacteria bacterium]|nr:hypothetical protein [Candidatus Saccharibacteria bacterium]
MQKHHKSLLRLLSPFILLTALLVQAIFPVFAGASQITTRSLTLVANGTTGGSTPGGVVNHAFAFTLPAGSNVGSIQFKYCTTAADTGALTCITPTGLVTTSATLSSQNGATGFSMVNTTNGAPYLARGSATLVSSNTAVTYQFNSITNPTSVNGETFFVRITSYASLNATGSPIDSGTVAAATNRGIDLTGTMPESLVFCAGATVGTTSSVPDCSTVTTGAVAFSQLFSPTDTATATSQMAASTNAGSGYAITVNGPTLTSGSNTVTGMAASGLGSHGISQFGLNLKANTTLTSTVAIGSEVAVASNGTNYRGEAAAGYNTVDNFKFASGNTVADSANGGAGGSDAQIFTASYIVNVPGSQPAGTYTTTLTYICTPTF